MNIFLKNAKKTLLGRWGITHEKALDIYNRTKIYDHSLPEDIPKEFCKIIINNIKYCEKCKYNASNEKLYFENSNFAYMNKEKCKIKNLKEL